jgi:hypothetical protein
MAWLSRLNRMTFVDMIRNADRITIFLLGRDSLDANAKNGTGETAAGLAIAHLPYIFSSIVQQPRFDFFADSFDVPAAFRCHAESGDIPVDRFSIRQEQDSD